MSMGRPKERKLTTLLTVSIEAADKERLQMVAKREGESVSKIVEKLVEAYLHAHLTGNEQYSLDRSIEASDFHALPTIWCDPTFESLNRISKEDRESMVSYMEKWYSAIQKSNKGRRWD